MKRVLLSLALASAIGLGLINPGFADGTIDTLTAGTALAGTESIPMFQTANPAVKTTPSAIATYYNSLLGTGVATFLTTPSSANLLSAMTTKTGTGNLVFGTSPTLVTPALGTPASGTLTNTTGFPIANLAGAGTGVLTALGVNIGSGGAPVLFGGAGGTPSSLTLTNATGLPIAGTTGYGAGVATALAIAPGTTGSFPTQDGAITTGHCLQWGPGIQDSTAVCGGSGSSGANPTATAGPAAVNGAATTFLRSDGAPAIQLGTAAQKGIVQVDGTTITAASGVISAVPGVTSRTATTTDTILSTDRGNVVFYNSSSAIAVSQPAPTSSFAAGFFTTLCNINTGTPTVTPGSGTIDGGATYAIPTGTAASPSCISYQSDGTNFNAVDLQASYGANVQAAIGKALNASGGVLGQSLIGTSGATLPLLNGTNTFSGTQTFGNVFGTVTAQAGTTYTLASTDCGTEIDFTNAAAVTVTIPATLTTGCNIVILQTTSAGQVTVTGAAVSAATLHSAHSYTKTFGQWAAIGINIYTTGVAILTGDGA